MRRYCPLSAAAVLFLLCGEAAGFAPSNTCKRSPISPPPTVPGVASKIAGGKRPDLQSSTRLTSTYVEARHASARPSRLLRQALGIRQWASNISRRRRAKQALAVILGALILFGPAFSPANAATATVASAPGAAAAGRGISPVMPFSSQSRALGSFNFLPTKAELELCFRLLYAVCSGAFIGLERSSSDRPAGIRTMALVGLGACVYTVCSTHGFLPHTALGCAPGSPLLASVKVDLSRMASNVATGVGFLGAGAIHKAKLHGNGSEAQNAIDPRLEKYLRTRLSRETNEKDVVQDQGLQKESKKVLIEEEQEIISYNVTDGDTSEMDDLPDWRVGSGEYQIVGIRYYNGVAHPGEFVTLVREPSNPYDRNAIRVDNLHGQKVGHIKATMAKHLAPVMDDSSRLGVRLEGTIPRRGSAYNLPLVLDFYSTDPSEETARTTAQTLQSTLRSDYHFRLTEDFAPAGKSSSPAPAVSVVKKKLDWNAQQAALDEMFDKHLKEQYADLPDIDMPSCLQGITLLDYQIQGIKWLVKREKDAAPAPFYKKVTEKGQTMYLCDITQSSQAEAPKPTRGSILCDEMGLGKSIQTLGLILLAPPEGVEYKVPESAVAAEAKSPVAAKRCTLIVCPVSVLSNWTDQVAQFIAPGVLNVELYHGPNRHDILPDVRTGGVDILLVSYNTLAADFDANGKGGAPKKKKAKRESIFDIDFHRIVLDEAHTIRNSKTRSFKAVSLIKADRKLALTGTPFVNTADDIFSLVSFLGVEPLNEQAVFRRAITQAIKNGDEIGLARLRTTMGFLSLRRSKQNVNIKLVEKEVQLCSVEFMEDAHKQVYDALFGTVRCAMEAILGEESSALKNYSVIFEKLLRLRQACCSGLLLTQERRDVAIKVWNELQKSKASKKLTAEEGLVLLEKLRSAFAEETTPECGICLMEMEECDGTVLRKCGHVFCKLCIGQVIARSNKKCPYCRQAFSESDIVSMVQASTAAKETSDEKPSGDLAFGTPPKIQALLAAIQEMKNDEKGVIFSQFTSHLDITAMKEEGHAFVRIDGSVPAQKRIQRIQRFNAEDATESPRFILCSLLAAGTGLNLTRANHAFMMDVWWNEAVESQAMDRIHRISQTRKVHVSRFVMKGSIEERIIKVQERKSLQAKGVLQKLKGDEKRKALLGDLRGLLDIDDGQLKLEN
ncbi:hypothetical protein ACHAXT_002478 [Thalassiosira profunda]